MTTPNKFSSEFLSKFEIVSRNLLFKAKNNPKPINVYTRREEPSETLWHRPTKETIDELCSHLRFGMTATICKKHVYNIDKEGNRYYNNEYDLQYAVHKIMYKYVWFEDGLGGYNCAWIVNDTDADDFKDDYCEFSHATVQLNCAEDSSGKHVFAIPSEQCIQEEISVRFATDDPSDFDTVREMYTNLWSCNDDPPAMRETKVLKKEEIERRRTLVPLFTNNKTVDFTYFQILNRMDHGTAYNFYGDAFSYIDPVTKEEKLGKLTHHEYRTLVSNRDNYK